MGSIYAGLGEKDNSFKSLEEAYQDRSLEIGPGIKPNPAYDPLRSDARFRDLLRRVGLHNET